VAREMATHRTNDKPKHAGGDQRGCNEFVNQFRRDGAGVNVESGRADDVRRHQGQDTKHLQRPSLGQGKKPQPQSRRRRRSDPPSLSRNKLAGIDPGWVGRQPEGRRDPEDGEPGKPPHEAKAPIDLAPGDGNRGTKEKGEAETVQNIGEESKECPLDTVLRSPGMAVPVIFGAGRLKRLRFKNKRCDPGLLNNEENESSGETGKQRRRRDTPEHGEFSMAGEGERMSGIVGGVVCRADLDESGAKEDKSAQQGGQYGLRQNTGLGEGFGGL
jgi:hypothetical protein